MMHLPDEPELDPAICSALTMAVGGVCEWCRERYPLSHYEIHRIYHEGECPDNVISDPQKGILVLCPICHRLIHEDGVPAREQKEVVVNRPGPVRKQLRKILGYTPRPYTPPETDLERCYEDCFRIDSLDLYRAGG
jgi:hypothetical protein